jgi:hypothetical protein
MPRRDWVRYGALVAALFVIVFGALGWMLWEYKQAQTRQRQAAAAYDPKSTDDRASDACGQSVGIADYLNCILREVKPQREDKRSEYDLQAQQDMAAWALGMLVVSFLGLIATILGAVLLTLSLIYSARATQAAADAADAAGKTLAAERAWITWDRIYRGRVKNSILNDVYNDDAVAFAGGWINSGRSPALKPSIINKKLVVPVQDSTVPTFTDTLGDAKSTDSSVGVGRSISGAWAILTDEETQALARGEINVWFYSKVEYTDIFYPNVTRVSEACWRIMSADAVYDTATQQSGVVMSATGPQNRVT